MTADRRLITVIVAVVVGLMIFGQLHAFGVSAPRIVGIEVLLAVVALWPVILLVGAFWFGREVLASLRRIEAATAGAADIEPEFVHGS